MDKIEINLSAKFYIQQYGVEASVQAAMKADTMLERGDFNGFNAWMRIGRTIEDMQAAEIATKP